MYDFKERRKYHTVCIINHLNLLIMKTKINLLSTLAIALFTIFILGSCNNDSDFGKEDSRSKQGLQREHLLKMKQLCSEYGWDKDETASQKEFEEFLISTDYDTAKDFFELVKTGGTTINLTDFSQSTTKSMTRGTKLTYTLRGHHSSHVATSTTSMTVKYNRRELDVINTSVSSNPASTWSPNPTSTFSFVNNRCDIIVTGRVKWGFIKRDMTMKAYMVLRPNSEVVAEGKITSFRG